MWARSIGEKPKKQIEGNMASINKALDKLEEVVLMHTKDWDGQGVEAPNEKAINNTKLVISELIESDLQPDIGACVDGGLCVSFYHNKRYGDVECSNEGEILAVTSTEAKDTKVWEVEEKEIRETLDKINEYCKRKNDYVVNS
jgi:hypothetical protein